MDLFSVRIKRYIMLFVAALLVMQTDRNTGNEILKLFRKISACGYSTARPKQPNDDDGEVIMAMVRTRRLLKANRNLLRPRPWDLSSCEQRALWLCALPPYLVGGRSLQVVATRKELLRRERPPFVLKQPPLASKALAGRQKSTNDLSLSKEGSLISSSS